METEEQYKILNSKYQKLAAEYAKLRSQVSVLKKAVVEEQQKTTELKSNACTQDQRIRKLDQELDSVKFRNRQLEKRIEILQESSCTTTTNPQQQELLCSDSTLLLHVEQNKRLQESLAEVEEKYNQDVGRLKRVIEQDTVPRELFESVKSEFNERVKILNGKVIELSSMNSKLVDKLRDCGRDDNNTHHEEEVYEQRVNNNTDMVKELVGKLRESEVAKENLSTEVNILSMKLRRLRKGGMNNECADVSSKSPNNDLKTPEYDTNNYNSSNEINNLIGKCEVNNVIENDDENELVIQCLRGRITELVKVLQLSDSKCTHYYREALNLCGIVKSSRLSYKRLENEFGKLVGKYGVISDELEDTKRNYEGQVRSLSEHIAYMNDKVAGLVEEVGVLKRSGGSGSGGGNSGSGGGSNTKR